MYIKYIKDSRSRKMWEKVKKIEFNEFTTVYTNRFGWVLISDCELKTDIWKNIIFKDKCLTLLRVLLNNIEKTNIDSTERFENIKTTDYILKFIKENE